MNNVPLGPSAQPAPQPNDHWYGLVRHPIPGVEIIPMMRSHVMGGLVPISEVARSFAVTGINVLEARKNWRNSRAVYMSDELEEAYEAYHALDNEIKALPGASLGSLLAHCIQVACLAGQECIQRGWATPMDVRMAWSTIPLLRDEQGRDVQQLLTWLTHHVRAAWADPLHEVPETAYNPHDGEVILDGRSLDHFELLRGIYTVTSGIEAIAMAALSIDKRYTLDCLSHDPSDASND